jgi:hypothetical protein
MQRFIVAILIVAVLALGGGLIAATAYQAGLSTAVVTSGAAGTDGATVAPVVVQPYGWGWGWGGPGFGIFGFLGFLLVFFLFIGLLRAAFGRGRGWGPGPGNWDRTHGHPWESRARDTFSEWHREAHGEGRAAPPGTTEPPA